MLLVLEGIEPSFFFFQAEDGIRDLYVTGVQTCALPIFNVPYEFLNIGGRKMSTSKGLGAAAHAIAEVVPPEQLRFLFLRPRPNSVIEFDPDGTDAIPRLFDEFDRAADATAGRPVKGTLPPSPER